MPCRAVADVCDSPGAACKGASAARDIFRPEDWPFGKGPRYDAGRRLVETGVGWRGRSVSAEDNLKALEAGALPPEAVDNVIRYLEPKGVDCTRFRKDHPKRPERLGPPLATLPDHRLGLMLDVSRDKVPTMATLKWLTDLLARLGFNELQLYTEHTFAYARHETAWRGCSPMTAAEIRELDDYCYARGIRLTPNQNSFGHLEKWFTHHEYLPLAEKTNGTFTVTGHPSLIGRPSAALCPTDPKAAAFMDGLYAELLPNFRHADVINVGCDETWDIFDVEGRSAAAVREKGVDRVYMDHLLTVRALAAKRGFRIAYWADMVLFFPRILNDMPKDAVALFWGYGDEAQSPGITAEYEGSAAVLKAAGADVTVCPSTRTFGWWAADFTRTIGNVRLMGDVARKYGFKGCLLTAWGDGGHRAPILGEVPGMVCAAAMARGENLDERALAAAVDKALGCKVGEALLAIGRADRKDAAKAAAQIRAALVGVDARGLSGPVATGIETYRLAADILDGTDKSAQKARYRELWLRDNRPGGLDHSVECVFGKAD